MPAVSKKQQKFFGIVRAIQKGEMAPTTPETAKAAADMKKGDVKKFASTKHKGLPEKKKIEEDRQINKIIKQLRKSVKSHKKQADTLEKKVKTFKESAFTNITVGNKVGQTFQHASGATITLDNTMSDPSDLPSQVTIDLGFGDFLTVPAPTTNEYGIAGITSSLGNAGGGGGVQTRQPTKTADEINQQLDASQQASGAETAKVGDALTQLMFGDTETPTEKAIKNLIGHIGGYHPSGPQRGELVSHVADRGTSVVDIYMKELTKYGIDQKKHVEKITKEYKAFKQDLRDSGQTSNEINKNRYIKAFKSDIERETKRLNHIKQDQLDLRGAKSKLENIFQERSKKSVDQIGDTQGEFMPSNPPGMRQQIGVDVPPEVKKFADKDTLEKVSNGSTTDKSLLQKTISFSNKSSVVNKVTDSVLQGPLSKYKAPVKLFLGYLTGTIPENEAHTVLTKNDVEQAWSDLYIDPSSNSLSVEGTMQNVIGGESLSKLSLSADGKKAKLKFGFQPHVNEKEFAQHPDKYSGDFRSIGGLQKNLRKAVLNYLGSYSADLQVGPGFLRPIGGAIASKMTQISKVVDFLTPDDTILGNIKTGRNLKGEIEIDINKLKNGSLNQKQVYDYLINKDNKSNSSQTSDTFASNTPPQQTFSQMQQRIDGNASKYTPQQIKTAADMHISVETLVNSHNRAIKAGSKNSGIDSKAQGLIKAGNWSWSDYIDRMNAINMAANDRSAPLHKKLRELPVDNRPNRGPSKAAIALLDAIEKITIATGKQLEALDNAWTEYNKLKEPPTTGGISDKKPPTGFEKNPPEVPRYDSNFAFPAGSLLPKPKADSEISPYPLHLPGPTIPNTEGEFVKGVWTVKKQGKTKGGQGGRRLGSTTQRQGGAYNPRNPYGTGLDRTDTSFKKTGKQKKNVRGSGARGGRKGKVNESKLSFELIQQFREESNPRIPRKKGQPANSKKHSDLYTDENPKGTIHGLGFKDVATSKASVSKIRNSSRSHAHKIQAAVAMEQRAREMGKTSEAAVYRKYINSMKKKTKKMNEAANPAQQAAIAISMKKKGIKPKNLKEQIQFAQMQQRIRDAKEKRREQQKKSEKLYIDTKKKGVKFYDKKGSGRLKDGKKIYD